MRLFLVGLLVVFLLPMLAIAQQQPANRPTIAAGYPLIIRKIQ
ncbi:hypothetical protein [Spirosoma harenae]